MVTIDGSGQVRHQRGEDFKANRCLSKGREGASGRTGENVPRKGAVNTEGLRRGKFEVFKEPKKGQYSESVGSNGDHGRRQRR